MCPLDSPLNPPPCAQSLSPLPTAAAGNLFTEYYCISVYLCRSHPAQSRPLSVFEPRAHSSSRRSMYSIPNSLSPCRLHFAQSSPLCAVFEPRARSSRPRCTTVYLPPLRSRVYRKTIGGGRSPATIHSCLQHLIIDFIDFDLSHLQLPRRPVALSVRARSTG